MRDEHAVAAANQDAVARASTLMAGLGVQTQTSSASFSESESYAVTRDTAKENVLVSKLVLLLDHENPDVLFEMLQIAKTRICHGGRHRASQTLVAVVFASVKLVRRLYKAWGLSQVGEPTPAAPPSVSVAAEQDGTSTSAAAPGNADQAEKDDLSSSAMPKPNEAEETVGVESDHTATQESKADEIPEPSGIESDQAATSDSKTEGLETREDAEAMPTAEAASAVPDNALSPAIEETIEAPPAVQRPKPIVR
jgi:vacuolar protein sorting-associated protein 35